MTPQALTSQTEKSQVPPRLLIPAAPVLALDGHKLLCLTTDGELKNMTVAEAQLLVRGHMPIVCDAPRLAARLGLLHGPNHNATPELHAYDVLELFAFIHPGKFAAPTPRGLSKALNLIEPDSAEDQCLALRDCIRHLLVDLTAPGRVEKSDPAALAAMMRGNDQNGWPWSETVLTALGRMDNPPSQGEIRAALRVWDRLPEWSVHGPEPLPAHHGVSEEEAAARLDMFLRKQKKENRDGQRRYAAALAEAFAPNELPEQPRVVLAEAGTGVGKTLGYLAPATVWAEKNDGAVWISTFTRNLQRQVDAELDRFYDDPVTKSRKVVTRKGRENYLCLLNLEELTQPLRDPSMHAPQAVQLGLMLRWAAVTRDGDFAGKDFPGWLNGLLGRGRVAHFADRRGECVYSACAHFHKCFIEKSVRKAKRADIVIANHALVMQNVTMNKDAAARYVFDEGHHLFEAADGVFGLQLNGRETADLRRWLLGTESQTKSRARGAKRRLEDLISEDDAAARKALDELMSAARGLPAPNWRQRMREETPKGAAEVFLGLCRRQVMARNTGQNDFYSLETGVRPTAEGLIDAAEILSLRLQEIKRPIDTLIRHLQNRLDNEAAELDADMRERISYAVNSLEFRAKSLLGGWIAMLDGLKAEAPGGIVDWMELTRVEGREFDVGFYRAFVDPAALFAAQLKQQAHGVAVTSATLRDTPDDGSEGWKSALIRTGAGHLAEDAAPKLFHVASPFDYAAQTRVIVVTDVKKNDAAATAAAYRELFLAAGGGALGIFTAVQRLKAVHENLLPALESRGVNLYAQHVEPLDIGTLIDIFREEENACLLGTDATRDGIDVPGRSLRLVVYDRVPWPKPTILHKARRAAFGKNYDDMLTRFKLKQAYGRLIRRADDRGVFVMLDSALPSRLLGAFPQGVAVTRVGLAEAIRLTADFLTRDAPAGVN